MPVTVQFQLPALTGSRQGKSLMNIPRVLYCKNLDNAYLMSHPRGAMGWLEVSDCGIFWSYPIIF